MSLSTIAGELEETARQADAHDDPKWSANDWIAFVNAYTGRAAEGVRRNVREDQKFRDNMVKAGGLIINAIAAYDNGYV